MSKQPPDPEVIEHVPAGTAEAFVRRFALGMITGGEADAGLALLLTTAEMAPAAAPLDAGREG